MLETPFPLRFPEDERNPPNIHQMIDRNRGDLGIWIRRITWGNSCAQIVDAGQRKGPAPYYGNPAIYADIYDLRTGQKQDERAKLPVPATFKTWREINPPAWATMS